MVSLTISGNNWGQNTNYSSLLHFKRSASFGMSKRRASARIAVPLLPLIYRANQQRVAEFWTLPLSCRVTPAFEVLHMLAVGVGVGVRRPVCRACSMASTSVSLNTGSWNDLM